MYFLLKLTIGQIIVIFFFYFEQIKIFLFINIKSKLFIFNPLHLITLILAYMRNLLQKLMYIDVKIKVR